jgi:hypothetical protein
VSRSYPATVPATVIAGAGDTLRTIASRVFGDESLWYLIADENGLTDPDAAIEEGQSLKIPNRVVSLSNTANSFKPFNIGDAIGDTTPAQPAPPAAKNGCGVVGMILIVVVAIIVTIYTAGAAAGGANAALASGGSAGSTWAAGTAALSGGLTSTGTAVGAAAVGGKERGTDLFSAHALFSSRSASAILIDEGCVRRCAA